METLISAFRFLALSQVLFFLVSIAISRNPARVTSVGMALGVGILAYLIAPVLLEELGVVTAAVLWTLASLVPSLLLLFTWVVFEEHKNIPRWLGTLFILDVMIEVTTHVVFVKTGDHSSWFTLPVILKRLAFVLGSLYLLWRGKECDLVETRVRLRWWTMGSIALLVFLIDFSHVFTAYVVPPVIELPSMVAVFLLTLIINVAFMRYNPRMVLAGDEMTVKRETSDPEAQDLLAKMVEERLYADHDLRIGSLAQTLGMPEYQLRKTINKGLGYRNFNQFVNRYRIEEAGQRLQQDSRLPVLSVALDVGFRSISSFNTAFQNHYGVSPSVFRKNIGLNFSAGYRVKLRDHRLL